MLPNISLILILKGSANVTIKPTMPKGNKIPPVILNIVELDIVS